jgi:tetratricopeptide (TPR) repeat protein
MEQEGPSFWSDIKKYEDALDKDPNSYCFAPLSELYRKVGMVDDAIIIAKRGCELHPEYVGGYIALGRAYFEKGMNAECRQALEKVVRVTPDNLLAQRILGQIYIDAGEITAAEESLKTILAQNPDDVESRILLNSLTRISGANTHPAALTEEDHCTEKGVTEIEIAGNELLRGDDEEILDLLESDIVEEFPEETEQKEELPNTAESDISAPDIFEGVEMEHKDPLLTVTLAELYLSQGFPERAVKIYRELQEADPDNAELKNRLVALEKEIHKDEANAGELSLQPDYSGPGALAPPEVQVADVSLLMETGDSSSVGEPMPGEDRYPARNEEQVIHTLEIWMENIRRRRNGS